MEIRFEHLRKCYGESVAIPGMDLTFPSGALTALLGPSGCGKTTTLNMLAGIVPVTSGSILFDGRDVTDLPPEKRGVGLVFQNYALYPHMTVLQNICFPMEIKKVPKAERIARARALAEMVHIADMLDRRPGELSGGQQQRVAIARALAKRPDVLLLDEPLSNLDAKLRVEMREEIRRIQRESGVTAVFVTHDQAEASAIADEVVILDHGELQQHGSARALYDEPANLFVADFLGTPAINKLFGTVRGASVELDGGSASVPFAPAAEVAEGTPVVLGVRCEAFDPACSVPALLASVTERYAMGKDELVAAEVSGQVLRAYVPSDLAVREGDTLALGIRARGAYLFDAATGRRLA